MEKFVRRYLSHWLRFETPAFHREIYCILQRPDKYPKSLLIAPRFFAKSVILMLFDTLYDILIRSNPAFSDERNPGFSKDFPGVYDPDLKYELIIGSKLDKATGWIRRIKKEIQRNPLILKDFGDLSTDGIAGEKWTEDIITFKTGFMLQGIGWDSSSRGEHPQKVKMDDIENKDSARSKEQCSKIEDWIKSDIEPMSEDYDPNILWIGTILRRDCVIDLAFEGKGWDSSWYRRKWGCYDSMSAKNPKWPDRWPVKKLERRRSSMGTIRFMAEYMNEPMATETPIVRKEWIKYYKQVDLPSRLYKVMAIDPAISEKETADYTAILVLGIALTGENKMNIYILDIDQGHWNSNAISNRVFEMYNAYNPDQLIVETIAFQQVLAQNFLRESRDRGIYLPVTEVKPHRDKYTRALAISGLFENGYVRFLDGNLAQDELISELLNFPQGRHDDRVDALVMALSSVQEAQNWVDDSEGEYVDDEELAIPELGY